MEKGGEGWRLVLGWGGKRDCIDTEERGEEEWASSTWIGTPSKNIARTREAHKMVYNISSTSVLLINPLPRPLTPRTPSALPCKTSLRPCQGNTPHRRLRSSQSPY